MGWTRRLERYALPDWMASHALVAGVLIAWFGYAAYLFSRNPVVLLSDFFGFIVRAQHLSFADASVWVHGLYPFGYPLLLRATFVVTDDYEAAGRLISGVAGACGLLAIYLIGTMAFSRTVAVFGMLMCASNPTFITWGANSGTDMPSAACVLLALVFGMRADRGAAVSDRDLGIAGAILGVGYLFRYTTLLCVPGFLLWLWIRPCERNASNSPRHVLRNAACLLLGFIAASSPQLIMTSLVRGNPLWNEQGANVYFGMFGGMDWELNWQEAARHPSITEVILSHPRRFIHSFIRNVLTLPLQQLVPLPVTCFAVVGLLMSLARERAATSPEYSRRVLVAVVVAVISLGTCIAFCIPRFLVCVAMLMSLFAAFGFGQTVPRCVEVGIGRRVPFRCPFALACAVVIFYGCVLLQAMHPLDSGAASIISTAKLLRDDGNKSPAAVLAVGFKYYDVDSPLKEAYATTWYEAESQGRYTTVESIVAEMRKHGQRYLVTDRTSPKLLGWPEDTWNVTSPAWKSYFDVLTRENADTTVMRLRDE